MSQEILDQLRLWNEWIDSRTRELLEELPKHDQSLQRSFDSLVQRSPDAAGSARRLQALSLLAGEAKGQASLLQETKGNLEYFLELGRGQGLDSDRNPDFVTQSILEAQEEERYRTSIEIHDGPAQSLANVIMRLEFCEKLAQRDGAKAAVEILDVKRELEEVLVETRRLIFDLRPMTLDDLGLIPTLQRYGENERERLPCDVQVHVRGNFERYSRSAETHVYRIVQEGLRNAARHGHPFRIKVDLSIQNEFFRLEIFDDGSGFSPEEAKPGMGMAEIRRRVRALDGTVQWNSAPLEGCQLVVNLPLARMGSSA